MTVPLFAAASAAKQDVAEITSRRRAPPDDVGGAVVEDYGHVGLSLRSHPVSFLREDCVAKASQPAPRRCKRATDAGSRRWTCARPANARSAKGVMFITIEDETAPPISSSGQKLYEKQRRVISPPHARRRRPIQREGDVVHLVARELRPLALLASVGNRDLAVHAARRGMNAITQAAGLNPPPTKLNPEAHSPPRRDQ